MQGKRPSLSVILCESRESRNTISQAWTPAFTARVTNVSGQGAGQAPHSVRHSLRKQGIQKYNQSSMDPRFYSEGDDGVGKHPSPSFSRRRKSRNTVSQEWTSVLKKCYEHYGLVYMRHAHFVLNEVLKV